jgi:hypothetical protein
MPVCTTYFDIEEKEVATHFYRLDQLHQVREDTLKEAVKLLQDMKKECGEPDSMQACLNRQMMTCADAIRGLMKK